MPLVFFQCSLNGTVECHHVEALTDGDSEDGGTGGVCHIELIFKP